jgi:hypothetical protein
MKYLTYTIAYFAISIVNTYAQQMDWLGHFRSTRDVKTTDITNDNDGNIYLIGTMAIDSADLDPGADSLYLSPEYSSATFVCKLDSLGTLQWAKRFGGGSSMQPKAVAVDDFGGVYVGGSFFHTVDFDPGPGVHNLSVLGGSDLFLTKLNNNGDFQWAFNTGGTSTDMVTDVEIDANNNVYITGAFDYGDFDPGPGSFTLNPSEWAGFIAKYRTDGSFVHAVHFEGNGPSNSNSLAIAPNGSLYVVGAFDSTVDFDPGPSTATHTSVNSNVDIYVCKLDTTLTYHWSHSFGSSSADNGHTVSVNAQDEPVISGGFWNTIDVDPGPNTYNVTSNGIVDNVLIKLNSNGDFVWANTYGNSITDGRLITEIADNDDIYIIGKFSDTIDIDGGPGIHELFSNSSGDTFITRVDGSGNLIYAGQMGGPSPASGTGICISNTGLIYHTGTFYGTADLNPGQGLDSLVALGQNDSYVQIAIPSDILDVKSLLMESPKLIRTLDIYGRDTVTEPGKVLILIYSDGSSKKIFYTN